MRFSIQWWGFSSGWRRPGHSPLCVIRAGATLTVLICRGSTRRRRGLRFLLKVCNNDCQISNGNFQMLSTTPIHIFQSWPGFLMTVLFASCFLFTFSFLLYLFLFLWLCRGTNCWVTCCATNWETGRGFRVEVPFRTSHIMHLKASALFRKVQTLQSQ